MIFCGGVHVDDLNLFPLYVLFVFVLCLMPNVACVSGLVFFLVVFVTKHLDFRQLRKVKVESSPIIIITCFNLPSQHNSSTKAISLVSS
jgi:hypothetical protein